jgi:hypothetical protein
MLNGGDIRMGLKRRLDLFSIILVDATVHQQHPLPAEPVGGQDLIHPYMRGPEFGEKDHPFPVPIAIGFSNALRASRRWPSLWHPPGSSTFSAHAVKPVEHLPLTLVERDRQLAGRFHRFGLGIFVQLVVREILIRPSGWPFLRILSSKAPALLLRSWAFQSFPGVSPDVPAKAMGEEKSLFFSSLWTKSEPYSNELPFTLFARAAVNRLRRS